MKPKRILLDEIHVGPRHRKDLGDIDALAESIDAVGLLQPIGVNPDGELVFGQRRLEAVRQLGWDRVDVLVVNVDILEAERDENEVRKDFTVSERVAIAKAIAEEIGNRQGERTDKGDCELPEKIPEVGPGKETRRIAAEKAGFGNETTYRQASKVVDHGAPELVEAMDRGEVSISKAAKLAALPRAQQKKAIAGGKAAMREALVKEKAPKEEEPFNEEAAWDRVYLMNIDIILEWPKENRKTLTRLYAKLAEEAAR